MDITFDAKGKTQEELGSTIVTDIAKSIYKAEDEFYELLADILGVLPDKVADMEVKDLITELKAVVTELINFMKKPME